MALDLDAWRVEHDVATRERIDWLGEQLRTQAADAAAAEYRWLCHLEEFERVGGWAEQGARSCAAWLSWGCGMSPAMARDKVRVARALPGLPVVSARMASGELSYSKVRAITRVATPANEQLLVEQALEATAAHLEHIVRGLRSVDPDDDDADAQREFERRRVRTVWRDGQRALDVRLAADDFEVVMGVLHRIADELQRTPPAGADATTAAEQTGDRPVVADPVECATPREALLADALRIMAESYAATGPVAQRGDEAHLVVVNAQVAAPVPEPAETASAEAPAAAEDMIAAASAWAARLGLANKPTLNGTPVGDATALRLACDADVVTILTDQTSRVLGIGRRSAKVPPKLKRALKLRDGGCRFPGCTQSRFVDAHHIVHWEHGGPTDLANLVLLCRFHHRLVHEAGYTIAVIAPGLFRFHRPDGTPVPHVAPPVTGDPARPLARNAAAGVVVDDITAIPAHWDGRTPDYSAAVGHLADLTYDYEINPN